MMIVINGVEYPLATTLRVAYVIQGQHNHKSYIDVFKTVGEMTLEDQIGMLYAAFSVANPGVNQRITRQVFLDYYLDNFNVAGLMEQLEEIMGGIMGTELVDKVKESEQSEVESSEDSSGN